LLTTPAGLCEICGEADATRRLVLFEGDGGGIHVGLVCEADAQCLVVSPDVCRRRLLESHRHRGVEARCRFEVNRLLVATAAMIVEGVEPGPELWSDR
jgi:hypothetical protein